MSASWPNVLDEDATVNALLSGKSIARYGDGELKLCVGGDCISQIYSRELGDELREILWNPDQNCIVGTIRKVESPKNWFWDKITKNKRYISFHNPNVTYYSQWITRPDSAPWINTPEFWNKVIDLWRGKDVVLVAGSDRSLSVDKLKAAKSVEYIECLYRDTYHIIDELEERCLKSPHKTVLLCCGATATILANRLSKQGKQALDMGHLGFFREFKENL